MRVLLIVVIMMLMVVPADAVVFISSGGALGSAPCTTSISDDFSGDLSLWTEHGTSGQWDIFSTTLRGLDQSVILYTDEQTCTVTQWMMAKFDYDTNSYAGFYFRSENNESAGAYGLRWEQNGGKFMWRHCGGAANSNTAEDCTDIGAGWTRALDDNDYVGVTVAGTGTDTVVTIYDLGTSAVPYANWAASADSSQALTDDPGQEANVGKYVGFYNGASVDVYFDNFTAGSP